MREGGGDKDSKLVSNVYYTRWCCCSSNSWDFELLTCLHLGDERSFFVENKTIMNHVTVSLQWCASLRV